MVLCAHTFIWNGDQKTGTVNSNLGWSELMTFLWLCLLLCMWSWLYWLTAAEVRLGWKSGGKHCSYPVFLPNGDLTWLTQLSHPLIHFILLRTNLWTKLCQERDWLARSHSVIFHQGDLNLWLPEQDSNHSKHDAQPSLYRSWDYIPLSISSQLCSMWNCIVTPHTEN